jgi:hypothetical protein
MKKEQNIDESQNPALRVGDVSPRFFNFKGLDGKNRAIEIPEKACKIHITWGSDLSSKGVFLWYQLMGDWKLHCLSRTQWMCNLEHFTKQLESWLLNEG